VASLALLASPGPTNILLASAGATAGRGALSLLTAEVAGYVVSVGALVMVVGPALAAMPIIFVGLKFVVAAWLLWTASSLWRSGAKNVRADRSITPHTVLITTLLNPKTMVIAFGLMPPAAAGVAPFLSHLAGVAALTALTGGFWIGGGAALARVGAAPYACKTSALTLGAFGAFLAGSAIL
jgi:threonine/homoserine/homoserine lactone efflux protein